MNKKILVCEFKNDQGLRQLFMLDEIEFIEKRDYDINIHYKSGYRQIVRFNNLADASNLYNKIFKGLTEGH